LELPSIVLKSAALIVVAIASVCDLRTHKIPNKLTFPASAVGIIMQSIYFASFSLSHDLLLRLGAGFIVGILGWIVGVLIMSFAKLFLRQMGHGDTKLVAAVGTFLGPWLVLVVFLYYSLCFGIYACARMVMAVPWGQVWVSSEMKKAGLDATKVNLDELARARKEVIPVAPLIALGTLLCIIFEKPTVAFLGFK